jgi:TolB-like protein/tetratricopeptide (TPR) repeat protein
MGVVRELRRRKVFRVAVVYAATAFVVLQAADILLPAMGVPEWAMGLIVALLALGFPVALVLGWALELTPEGVRVTGARPDPEPAGATPSLLGRRTIVAAALLVAVGLGLGAGWFLSPAPRPAEPTAPELSGKSVAVLPFADFSPDADQGWFADGLAEEILNSLANTPDLKVASRTASFAFKGSAEAMADIAGRLGVVHILEGSVRRDAARLRVTAQLIRAADGYHLWSDTFDGSTGDAIAVQERIAMAIARSLRTAMDPDAMAAMLGAGTRAVDAWEAYLRAQALSDEARRSGVTAMELEAIAELERAITLDPGFARAHGALAEFWATQTALSSTLYGLIDLPPGELRRRFAASIAAAIQHAPTEEERLRYQVQQAQVDLQLARAVDLAREWTRLQPEQARPWLALGAGLVQTADYDRARDALLRAADLVAANAVDLIGVAEHLHRTGDTAAVVAVVDRALAADPTSAQVLYQGHRALLHAGRVEQAAELAARFARLGDSGPGALLVQLRQACAEGRLADAERLGASVDREDPNHWLVLKILGRDAEARPVLAPFDTPEQVTWLRNHLYYPFFDVTELPVLARSLASQGIVRPPPRPMPFACRAGEEEGGP